MIEILDTTEVEQFVAMRYSYSRPGQGFIMVYSITSKASLDGLSVYIDQIAMFKNSSSFPLVVVGNKCDLEDQREVSTETGEAFSNEYNAKFIESSAKANIYINEIFHTLITEILAAIPKVNRTRGGCLLL
uniref:Uncharacterized protein n=1 Tax=Arcella intermedia TaxID=1963864 RepID=A0A6B2LKT5_9EUKA